jgi:hypothetical protein
MVRRSHQVPCLRVVQLASSWVGGWIRLVGRIHAQAVEEVGVLLLGAQVARKMGVPRVNRMTEGRIHRLPTSHALVLAQLVISAYKIVFVLPSSPRTS